MSITKDAAIGESGIAATRGVSPATLASVDAPPRARLDRPAIVTLSSLFPSRLQPNAGPFVRERMFRVGQVLPLCVVAPAPWFPLQSLLSRFRRGFRAGAPAYERQDEFDVWYPRFFSVPGVLKAWDGFFMALGAYPRLAALKRARRLDILDAHFAYPDGYAATLLGRWLRVPVTITLRGKEARQVGEPALRSRIAHAVCRADRIFTVSQALARIALSLGAAADRVKVVGNGVDTTRFSPVDRVKAREALGVPADAAVLLSVGGLVERKGFHRVLDCLPELLRRHDKLVYLIVGGPGPEGDFSKHLHAQTAGLGVGERVRFLGPMASSALPVPLSAADVFVLATSYEGWANVFLEAMACGLPVVTTDVGGNAEVVCDPRLGIVVPFGDSAALLQAVDDALSRPWDRDAIRKHAEANDWDRAVDVLTAEFEQLSTARPRRVRTDAA